MLKVLSTGQTDVGLKRTNNEDAYLVRIDLGLVALADGMGGAAAGELASQFFTESSLEVFSRAGPPSGSDRAELIQYSFELANQRILSHVEENPHHRGMGCTAELLVFSSERFTLGHVGDSRTYLFRQGRLRQLTQDHSLVQDQVNQGLITEQEARRHPLRNVILRAVGTRETLEVDLIRGTLTDKDIYLLCSDGLSDMIDDDAIRTTLALRAGLSEKAERLVEQAKSAGGLDNITVVLSEIVYE
ncbi:MAG: Stp1/IreP family PP2C-type Ser/Thr phosphatase [Deltaproteobacteria bacterium]|jgi:protein phosphatase|nr:Stp1/IreP family PP2C-type Ser/Thr phosphatase [Deltaproteobacteria bacterium]